MPVHGGVSFEPFLRSARLAIKSRRPSHGAGKPIRSAKLLPQERRLPSSTDRKLNMAKRLDRLGALRSGELGTGKGQGQGLNRPFPYIHAENWVSDGYILGGSGRLCARPYAATLGAISAA